MLLLILLLCTQAHADSYDNLDVRGLNRVDEQTRHIRYRCYTNSDIRHVERQPVRIDKPEVKELTESEKQLNFNNCVHNITRTREYLKHVREWETSSKDKALAYQDGLTECQERNR